MKKILIVISIILLLALIGFGLFYFLGNGKDKVSDFFSGDRDFGSFFDTEPQSQNDFVQNPPITDTPTDDLPPNSEYVAPILRQISFEPVSGYTFFTVQSTSTSITTDSEGNETKREFLATSTAIRFQERATGHLYDVFEFQSSPLKVSNITTQKIYNTLFSNNSNDFLHQNLINSNEQIRTVFNKLVRSTSTEPYVLQSDISSVMDNVVFNKTTNKITYSINTQLGVSNIYTANIDKTGEKLVTSLSFTEFLMDTINGTEVLVTTKASQAIPGYSYILNTTTGVLNKILGNIPGLLVKVSPDKKYYLYSQSGQSRPQIRTYDTTSKITNIVSVDTIPEKCVFSAQNTSEVYCFGALIYKPAQYPDDWYKGKVFNSETLYKINIPDNYIQQIYSFEEDNLSFDVINPQLTTKDGFIIFQNKYDLTLWSINLDKVTNEVF